LGAGNVFIPRVRAADDFDVVAALSIGPGTGDLDPLTRLLIGDAGAVLRQVAGLSVHLHRALARIFQRHQDVVFLIAAQHAGVPAPVEERGLQALIAGGRRVRRGAAATATATGASSSTSTSTASWSPGTLWCCR